jgi:hypothetical protein
METYRYEVDGNEILVRGLYLERRYRISEDGSTLVGLEYGDIWTRL